MPVSLIFVEHQLLLCSALSAAILATYTSAGALHERAALEAGVDLLSRVTVSSHLLTLFLWALLYRLERCFKTCLYVHFCLALNVENTVRRRLRQDATAAIPAVRPTAARAEATTSMAAGWPSLATRVTTSAAAARLARARPAASGRPPSQSAHVSTPPYCLHTALSLTRTPLTTQTSSTYIYLI